MHGLCQGQFLSIQAQDFIEEVVNMPRAHKQAEFLSIQAQDFIEDGSPKSICMLIMSFLSIQAQDFIEDSCRIDEWGILSDS